jgi:hypothetical protein
MIPIRSARGSGGIFNRLFAPDFHRLRLAVQTRTRLLVSIKAFAFITGNYARSPPESQFQQGRFTLSGNGNTI